MSKEERPSDQLTRLIMEIGGGWIAGKIIGAVIGVILTLIILLIISGC